MNACHRKSPESRDADAEDHSFTYRYHPRLNGTRFFCITMAKPNVHAAQICDEFGINIPPNSPPPDPPSVDDRSAPWHPFADRIEFDFAWSHFVEFQSSAGKLNKVLGHWAASLLKHNEYAPWANAEDLYKTIDEIQCGDAPWKSYKIQYQGPRPPTPPKWMMETYELCCRDSRQVLHQQLATSDFKGKFNSVPYQQFNSLGKRVYSNLMSGDWAWKQAVIHIRFLQMFLMLT
jgi:hypothetical protein